MEKIMPYMVLLGVSFVFFCLCWIVAGKTAEKKVNHIKVVPPVNEAHKKFKEITSIRYEDNPMPKEKESSELADASGRWDSYDTELEKTVVLPVAPDIDATRIMPRVIEENIPSFEEKKEQGKGTTSSAVEIGVSIFTHYYGFVTTSMEALVREVTEEAFTKLGIQSKEEAESLFENLVYQESLMAMQKAYVGTGTSWMKYIAVTAFCDVIRESKESTIYMVAYDALRILPQLRLSHLQSLAMILLLRYSRNTNNYSADNFRHYVKKYIHPFLLNIAMDQGTYGQLEYLRCSLKEEEAPTFKELLTRIYPYVFTVEGFTEEELSIALRGVPLDERFLVHSMNSRFLKLAVVDEGMLPSFFNEAGITDVHIQERLYQLMQSRPTSLEGDGGDGVLYGISHELRTLKEVYDMTPLGKWNLTLLGLYMAKLHVKGQIGEDFDISNWL